MDNPEQRYRSAVDDQPAASSHDSSLVFVEAVFIALVVVAVSCACIVVNSALRSIGWL